MTTNLHISTHTIKDTEGAIPMDGHKFAITATIAGVSLHSSALFGDENHAKQLISRMQAAIESDKITISIV